MRTVLLVGIVLLVTWLAVGQAPAPTPTSSGGVKLAVVQTERVLAESAEGKAVQAELERRFAPRQKELQARAAELEKLQTEFQQKQASMTDAERQRRALEIQQKQKSLERLNEDVTSDFNSSREEALSRLGKRVNDVVQKYGAEKQYQVIFDAGASGALYVAKGVDITSEILAAYNQQFPVKTEK